MSTTPNSQSKNPKAKKFLAFLSRSGILSGLAGAVIAAAVTIISFSDRIFSNTDSLILVDSYKYSLEKENTYKGWFVDYDDKQNLQLLSEDVTLNFYSNPRYPHAKLVRAKMSGNVWIHGIGFTYQEWEGSGYEIEDFLRLSYYSTKGESIFTHGVYVLARKGSTYQGYWEGKDSQTRKTIKGAYLLTDNLNRSDSEVLSLYPQMKNPTIAEVHIENVGKESIWLSAPTKP